MSLRSFTQIFVLIFTEKSIAVRLQGPLSSNGTGRVLIFYSGQWGTICNDSWDISDAQVVCRQLGYKDGLTTFGGGNVFRGSRKVWLDDANCTGSEQSLTSCLHSGWGNHNCSSSVGVGVECSLTGKFTVQLNTLYIFHEFMPYVNHGAVPQQLTVL
jgi:hypothetical protein